MKLFFIFCRPVRRFFCLLVTFDFLFTGLLWVITVIVTGKDIEKALWQQVMQYGIHSSMFDIVVSRRCAFVLHVTQYIHVLFGSFVLCHIYEYMLLQILAFMRFTICIIFYAIFDLKHWWPIAVSKCGEEHFRYIKLEWNYYDCQNIIVPLSDILLYFQLTTSGTSAFLIAKVFKYQVSTLFSCHANFKQIWTLFYFNVSKVRIFIWGQ